ncbi:MAG: D-alanyl-D-alanine carboxypeptidase family protein [Acidimicrobiales bacterium]
MLRTRNRTSPRLVAALVAVAALFAALVGPALPASGAAAASSTDPATQREQVRKKKAEVAGQIDTLNATSDQVNAALDALDENVRGAQAQANDAQRAAEAAQHDAEEAQRQADEAQATIDQLKSRVAEAAVDAFVHPPSDAALQVFEQQSADDAVTKSQMLTVANGNNFDVVDQFRAAKQQLEVKRDAVAKAQAQAAARAATLADKADGLQQARAQQAKVAAEVDQRINDKLAESAALASLDKNLSEQIASEQAALATKVSRVTPSGGGGGGGSGPVSVPGPIALTTVGGITVASSIASQVGALLSAASSAGFHLGGGGYRDSASQIALRRAHCGTSDYAIYEMPASQCHPPTAPPGQSMHERGLAIDFTNNGSLINSHSEPVWQWLSANAGRFGLQNLPSEPWHWSTNGN